MKRITTLGILLTAWSGLLGLFAGGCGGGGGNSAPANAATQLRTITPGLSYNYRFSGTVADLGGANPVNVSGTLIDTYTSFNLNSQTVIAGNLSGTVSAQGGDTIALNSTRYLVQNAGTGDLILIGDTNGSGTNSLRVATAPETFIPGTFGPGVSFTEQAAFDDGSRELHSFTVQGQETVKVPAGTFATWRCIETTNDGSSVTNQTEWYAPELGSFVKATVIQTDQTQNITLTINAEMTGTNAR